MASSGKGGGLAEENGDEGEVWRKVEDIGVCVCSEVCGSDTVCTGGEVKLEETIRVGKWR